MNDYLILDGLILIIWMFWKHLLTSLQNVLFVARKQQSDAQDVKVNGIVKGILF